MKNYILSEKDIKILIESGFGDYVIDLSYVPDEEIPILLDFLDRRNKIIKLKKEAHEE